MAFYFLVTKKTRSLLVPSQEEKQGSVEGWQLHRPDRGLAYPFPSGSSGEMTKRISLFKD